MEVATDPGKYLHGTCVAPPSLGVATCHPEGSGFASTKKVPERTTTCSYHAKTREGKRGSVRAQAGGVYRAQDLEDVRQKAVEGAQSASEGLSRQDGAAGSDHRQTRSPVTEGGRLTFNRTRAVSMTGSPQRIRAAGSPVGAIQVLRDGLLVPRWSRAAVRPLTS
jgi:hypothetical protein